MGTERDRDKKAEREKQMEGIRETEREGGGKAKEREGRDGEGEREGLLSGELKWGRGRGRRDMLPSGVCSQRPLGHPSSPCAHRQQHFYGSGSSFPNPCRISAPLSLGLGPRPMGPPPSISLE